MWTKSALPVFVLHTITTMMKCDLSLDADESTKEDQIVLRKIANEENVPYREYLAKDENHKNFYHSIIFQNQPQLNLVPMDIPTIMLNKLPEEDEYYYLHSIPTDGVLSTPIFLPITSLNTNDGIYGFSNIYEDPYENSNQVLRDNGLNYIFIELGPDASKYRNIYENNYVYREPISYITTNQFAPESSDFLKANDLPTFTTGFDNNSESNYQNNQSNYLYDGSYDEPQPYEALKNIPSSATHQISLQGTTHESPDIEIVKAIGYELPKKSSNRQSVALTRYFFDGESTTPVNLHKRDKSEKIPENWVTNSEEITETPENIFSNPIIVSDDVDDEPWKKVSSDQYFLSNRRPILFEGDNVERVEEVPQLTNKLSGTNNITDSDNTIVNKLSNLANTTAVTDKLEGKSEFDATKTMTKNSG